MKQGTGHSASGQRKREPIAHALNPGGVSQIGTAMGNHVTEMGAKMNPKGASKPLYEGRGYEAPMAGRHNYPSGSQRRS